MENLDFLFKCDGFEWDEDNAVKNWRRHRVAPSESEELFFNQPLVIGDDKKHSTTEKRFFALGQTDAGRLLFTVFTIRGSLIRVISARDMNRKERKVFLSS